MSQIVVLIGQVRSDMSSGLDGVRRKYKRVSFNQKKKKKSEKATHLCFILASQKNSLSIDLIVIPIRHSFKNKNKNYILGMISMLHFCTYSK